MFNNLPSLIVRRMQTAIALALCRISLINKREDYGQKTVRRGTGVLRE
ncbi:MAG: hypothetical protein KGV50_06820 [Gammaproteobacteria bacterium]|nr:hypothetical protein [Gammaproteobacteria bacterium]